MLAKDVIKIKMINVAGQMFIGYDRDLEESHQIIKNYEYYSGVDIPLNNPLNKFLQNNEIQNENDDNYKHKSIRLLKKFLEINKRALDLH